MSVLGSSDFAKGLSIRRQYLEKGEEVRKWHYISVCSWWLALVLAFQGAAAKQGSVERRGMNLMNALEKKDSNNM